MNSFPKVQVRAAQSYYWRTMLSNQVDQDVWLKYQTVPDQAGTMKREKMLEERRCQDEGMSEHFHTSAQLHTLPAGSRRLTGEAQRTSSTEKLTGQACLNEASTSIFGGQSDHFFTNKAAQVIPHSMQILNGVGMAVQSNSVVSKFKAKYVLSDHEPIVMTVRTKGHRYGRGQQPVLSTQYYWYFCIVIAIGVCLFACRCMMGSRTRTFDSMFLLFNTAPTSMELELTDSAGFSEFNNASSFKRQQRQTTRQPDVSAASSSR